MDDRINNILQALESPYRAEGFLGDDAEESICITGPEEFLEVYYSQEISEAIENCTTAEEVDVLFRTGGLAL